MDLASALARLVESAVEMPTRFLEVAARDPVSAVLVAFGVLFVGVAMVAIAYLGLGAFASLFIGPWSRGPSRRAR